MKKIILIGILFSMLPMSVFSERKNLDWNEYAEISQDGKRIVKFDWKTGKETGVMLDVATTRIEKIRKVVDFEVVGRGGDLLVQSEKRGDRSGKYYIFNVKRNRLEALTKGNETERDVAVSPDGRNIFFAQGKELYIKKMDYDDAVIRLRNEELAVAESKLERMQYWAQWSPDGRFCSLMAKEGGMTLAGEDKHQPMVYVFDAFYKSIKPIDLPKSDYAYVKGMMWTQDPEVFAVVTLSDDQSEMRIWQVNAKSLMYKSLIDEKESEWFDARFAQETTWLPDGKVIVCDEKDGYRHLQLYHSNGIFAKTLTEGKYDVTHFYGYDSVKKLCLFEMQERKGAGEKVKKICTVDVNGNVKDVVEDVRNAESVDEGEYLSVKTTNGDTLDCRIEKPKGWKASEKYSVVVIPYSVRGNDRDLEEKLKKELLAAGKVVVIVETRGVDGRGEGWRKSIYQRLGVLESADVLEVVKSVAQLSFVDSKRIHLAGADYGGMVVLMAMEKNGANLVKSSVVIDPISDLRNEEAEWAERYMRRPQASGSYDGSSVTKQVNKVTGDMLLVLNSRDGKDDKEKARIERNYYELTDALSENGKMFDMMVYRKKNEKHLLNSIVRYLK